MTLSNRYAAIDARTAAFSRATGIACPTGCGECCTSIHATIGRSEADAIATFLLDHPETLAGFEARADRVPHGTCPLYDADSPMHCTVYEARPLVCRAFGFYARRAKDGAPEYVPCRRFHETPEGESRVSLARPRAASLPILSDEALAIAPGGDALEIGAAVTAALDAARLRRALETGS